MCRLCFCSSYSWRFQSDRPLEVVSERGSLPPNNGTFSSRSLPRAGVIIAILLFRNADNVSLIAKGFIEGLHLSRRLSPWF
jgi:hypothetical protein